MEIEIDGARDTIYLMLWSATAKMQLISYSKLSCFFSTKMTNLKLTVEPNQTKNFINPNNTVRNKNTKRQKTQTDFITKLTIALFFWA